MMYKPSNNSDTNDSIHKVCLYRSDSNPDELISLDNIIEDPIDYIIQLLTWIFDFSKQMNNLMMGPDFSKCLGQMYKPRDCDSNIPLFSLSDNNTDEIVCLAQKRAYDMALVHTILDRCNLTIDDVLSVVDVQE